MRAKLTQVELGVRAGIDEFSASARVNQYERGKHSPDFGTATRLAAVLRVPAAFFYAQNDDLADLIVRYSNLKARQKREVVEFADRLGSAE